MRKSLIICALVGLATAFSPTAQAQGRKNLRINEVMVSNDSSLTDDFGRRPAWIEIINPTHAPVEISSIYLTNDPGNPTKYYVPRGDQRTRVGKEQQVVFFADGQDNEGTFHLNFTLTPGQDNFIAIYDADGISLIDSITVPAGVTANQSYARAVDAGSEWVVLNLDQTTPGTFNADENKLPNQKIRMFEKMDPDGFAMALMAMTIVFSALLLLCVCFMLISGLSKRISNRTKVDEPEKTPAPKAPADADAEVAAVIALALNNYLRGSGTGKITIVQNTNSAWSQKIMRELPK